MARQSGSHADWPAGSLAGGAPQETEIKEDNHAWKSLFVASRAQRPDPERQIGISTPKFVALWTPN